MPGPYHGGDRDSMWKYIIKRLLLIVFNILIVSFIVFLLCNITPSDPGRLKLGTNAPQEAVDQINHELGYDRPLPVRYFDWVWKAIHGDFGRSWYTNQPVINELAIRIPNTLKLTVLGLVTAIILGVPLGVWCAVKRQSVADYLFSTAAMLLAAMPVFWISLLLLLAFSLKLGWFPSYGVADGWKSWVLPVIPLTVGYGAGYIRFTRSAMLDNIRQDYVRTARAKGCGEPSVIWRHTFRNSLMTIVTITGLSFAGLMSGAFVIENVFSIPGLGVMGVNAITRKDMPQILASLVVIGTIFMVVMVIVDILYAILDPRTRSMYQSKKIVREEINPEENTEESDPSVLPDPELSEDMIYDFLKPGKQHEQA